MKERKIALVLLMLTLTFAGFCVGLFIGKQREPASVTIYTTKTLTDAAKHDRKALAPEETDKLDSLASKLASLERSLIQYADKLGFTPQGRVRLAQKRASAMTEDDPDADLFGDA